MQSKATTVDAYLKELPPDRRAAISAVREVIRQNLDHDYEEGMMYGMIGWYVPHRIFPAGYHCDPSIPLGVAGLASQKQYMSLYLDPLEHTSWFREAWAKAGKKLDMGKVCIRFKRLEDLALDVIAETLRRLPVKKYVESYLEGRAAVSPRKAKSKPVRAKAKSSARKSPEITMQSKAATVENYLAELPADRRAAISAVREVILKNLDSDYSERMQYGMIGYCVPHSVFPAGYHCDPKQPLPYMGLASQKNHMAIYVMGLYMDSAARKEFEAKWKKTGKKLDMGGSCLRFKKLEDLNLDIIGEIIRNTPAKKYIAVYQGLLEQGSSRRAKGSGKSKPGAKKSKPARKKK